MKDTVDKLRDDLHETSAFDERTEIEALLDWRSIKWDFESNQVEFGFKGIVPEQTMFVLSDCDCKQGSICFCTFTLTL